MDSRTGKKIRLGRILNPVSGRTIIVAASHAVLTGAPKGLKSVSEMRNSFGQLSGANGIMLAPGSVDKVEEIFVQPSFTTTFKHLFFSCNLLLNFTVQIII